MLLDILNLYSSQSELDPLMDAISRDRAAVKKAFARANKENKNNRDQARLAVNVMRRLVSLPSWRVTPEPTDAWVRQVLELAVDVGDGDLDLQWMDTLTSDTLIGLRVMYDHEVLVTLASAMGVDVPPAPPQQAAKRDRSTVKDDMTRFFYILHGDTYTQRLGLPQPETPLEDTWIVKSYPHLTTRICSPRSRAICLMLEHAVTPCAAISGLSSSGPRQAVELMANLCSLLPVEPSSLCAAVADQLWGEPGRYGPFVSSLELNERSSADNQSQDEEGALAQRIATALSCSVGILALDVVVYRPLVAKPSTRQCLHTFLTHGPKGRKRRIDPAGKEAWVLRLGAGVYASLRKPEVMSGPAGITQDMIDIPNV